METNILKKNISIRITSAFSKTSLNIWKFTVHLLLKPSLENFEHYFTSVRDECNCAVVWAFFGIVFLWDWNENWPFPVLWPLLSFPNLQTYRVQHLTASSLRSWNSPTGIPSPPVALFVVKLPKAHLTSYSRMSGSRWVITSSWLSGLWRSFLYSSSVYLKFSKSGFSKTWTMNFHMFKPVLKKAEEPEVKLPTSAESSKKQESSRKTSISALLTMPKPLTVWIPIKCGKLWKRWEYQTTWPASWETCMQVRKQQLELDREQTGSK